MVVQKTKTKPVSKQISKVVKIPEDSVLNPFFVGIDNGSVIDIKFNDIKQNYKHVFILCLNNSSNLEKKEHIMPIFQRIIKKTYLTEIPNIFSLVKANINIVKNFYLKKRANLVKGTVLQEIYPSEQMQIEQYDLDVIVIPIYELTEEKVNSYSHMYGDVQSLEKITDALSMVSYFNKSNKMLESNIVNTILTLDSNNHWKNPSNCKFNMDEMFSRRTLSYNGQRLDRIKFVTLNGAKTLNDLMIHINPKKSKIYDSSYHISPNDGKVDYMSMFQSLTDSENRTFYALSPDDQFSFTKEDVANLFNSITDDKYRFHLLNTLIVSKDLCHFVLNNKPVLQRNADLFEKYKPLYAYLFGYAWNTFYLEESIFVTKSTKNHRFAFDIDTANCLPVFPFSMENIHNNPYCTLLLSNDLIDPKTNCMSIGSLKEYKKYYGVCDREEALRRFNSFVSGDHNINIFKGLDPHIFSISGSIMPACIQKRSPLMDKCTNSNMSFDDIHNTFFKHFYGESDIDVMCGTVTLAEFFHHGSKFLETLASNLECERKDLKVVPNKKTAIILTKHFFRECLADLNNELGTDYTHESLIKVFDDSLSPNDDSLSRLPENIVEYFNADYVQEKKETVKKWRVLQKKQNVVFDSELLEAYNSTTPKDQISVKLLTYDKTESTIVKRDSDIYYFVNDFRGEDDQVPKEKNFVVFRFAESIKYKIESSRLKRTVEIFKVEPVDPFNTVARFHYPCVRAYMQGETFYMLPSFITAMMTSINVDYKYFAGSRDPVEIYNKYRMRGYSSILNSNEKKSILMYNRHIDTCNGQFKTTDDSQEFGTKSINDKIFSPGVYKLGLPEDIYSESTHEYINNVNELRELYEKECKINLKSAPVDVLSFTSIGKNGCINPLQSWVESAIYDIFNHTSN